MRALDSGGLSAFCVWLARMTCSPRFKIGDRFLQHGCLSLHKNFARRSVVNPDTPEQLKTAKERIMSDKVKPIPEGYTSVTPYLIVDGAAQAIEFYKQAFGAVEEFRFDAPGGK